MASSQERINEDKLMDLEQIKERMKNAFDPSIHYYDLIRTIARTEEQQNELAMQVKTIMNELNVDVSQAIKIFDIFHYPMIKQLNEIRNQLKRENPSMKLDERNEMIVKELNKRLPAIKDTTVRLIPYLLEVNVEPEEEEFISEEDVQRNKLVDANNDKYTDKEIERFITLVFDPEEIESWKQFNYDEIVRVYIDMIRDIAKEEHLDIRDAVRVLDNRIYHEKGLVEGTDIGEFISNTVDDPVIEATRERERKRLGAPIINTPLKRDKQPMIKTIADIEREELIQEAARKESIGIGYTSMSRTSTMTMNSEAGRAPIASAPVGSAVRILEPQIITNNYNPNVSNAALISSAPGASDQLNGGIRDWLKNQSAAAPLVDINKEVQQQRAAHEINKMVLTQSIIQGNADAYAKIQMYRDKLKKRAYRPQSRINEVPQFLDTMDMPYLGEMGTAGLPSNQPDRVNWVRDDTKIVTRGQIYPILNPDGTAASMKGVINGRSDFMENPNAHMYPPATEGSNMRLQPMHLGIGQGKIWGNRIPAPIGGPTFDTPVATPPPNRGLVRATDFFKHLPHGHQMKKTFGYSTHGAYGPNYVTSLSKAESQEIHGALKREAPLHATRLLPQTDNVYFSG